jgi:hypothetical protein
VHHSPEGSSSDNSRFGPAHYRRAHRSPEANKSDPRYLSRAQGKKLETRRKIHDFVLQELGNRAGDHETMQWEPGMSYPKSIDKMEAEC